jgi:hypothetical protein
MPVPTIPELEWRVLTELVNEIKGPQTFLQNLLFSNHRVLSTRYVEIPTIRGNRAMAGFTADDAEALMIEGLGTEAKLIGGISQRLKKAFTPTPLLFNRQHQDVIYLQGGDQRSMVMDHIARDSQRMVDMSVNSVEYLASQALTGVLAYTSEEDGVAFVLDFGKSAENTVVLGGTDVWTNSASSPKQDVLNAKRRQSDVLGLAPTDAIMGQEAADAWIANADVLATLDNRRVTSGEMDLTQQFNDQGVIFLGTWCGLRWWEYSRSIVVPGGGLVPLVAPKMVHFITRSPQAEQVLYFTAIRDMEAFMGGTLAAERFSKSWMEHDPSALIQLMETHPLPCLRRPDSIYSLQVVA